MEVRDDGSVNGVYLICFSSKLVVELDYWEVCVRVKDVNYRRGKFGGRVGLFGRNGEDSFDLDC